jgi:hypothetical protein
VFSIPVYEYVQREYEGNYINPEHPRYSLYSISQTNGDVGAVGNLGIGGSATARVIEELIARGIESFVIVCHRGSPAGYLDKTWSHLERLFDCAVTTLTGDT